MENELASFEKLAVEEIRNGKKWNGEFYEYNKRGTFIFVAGKKTQIINKQAFLEAIGQTEKTKMTYGEAYRIGGIDYAEEGNW